VDSCSGMDIVLWDSSVSSSDSWCEMLTLRSLWRDALILLPYRDIIRYKFGWEEK